MRLLWWISGVGLCYRLLAGFPGVGAPGFLEVAHVVADFELFDLHSSPAAGGLLGRFFSIIHTLSQ